MKPDCNSMCIICYQSSIKATDNMPDNEQMIKDIF